MTARRSSNADPLVRSMLASVMVPDVRSVGQFAVTPALQNRGIGSTLLDFAAQLAREQGSTFIALDTSEHAPHLIAFYQSRGYPLVEHHRWPDVNYRSVIMAKVLTAHRTDWI